MKLVTKKNICCLLLGWFFTSLFVTFRVLVQDGNPEFDPDAVLFWYLFFVFGCVHCCKSLCINEVASAYQLQFF